MTDKAQLALERIVAAANQQLDLLEDAAQRTDVDKKGLSEASLGLLLDALAAETDKLGGELGLFGDRVRALKAHGRDVREHLIALSKDWKCRHCKCDVASGAVIAGVKARKPKVELACKSCGRTTPLEKFGVAAFKALFVDQIRKDWNPELNGFVWNEK